MVKIQQVSTYMYYGILFLLGIMPIFMIAQWMLLEWEPFRHLVAKGILFKPVSTPEGYVNLAAIKISPLGKTVGILGTFVLSGFTYWGLIILSQLFKNYRCGEIFSAVNTYKYKYLGYLFFLDGLIAKPFGEMLSVLAVTLSNPPGHRYLTISFGTPNVETLFVGVIIIVVSWVMLEAYKLKADSELTI